MNHDFIIGARTIRVSAYRALPRTTHEFRVALQCVCLATGASSELTEHAIDVTGIADGHASLESEFWRKWRDLPIPFTATNAQVPAALRAGQSMVVDGVTWYGGTGRPPSSMGAIGEFYADLSAGSVYKKTRGTLMKLAEERANDFARYLDAVAQAQALGLPDLPVTPEALPT